MDCVGTPARRGGSGALTMVTGSDSTGGDRATASMERVLRAEREGEARVADCRREAERGLEAAREAARHIARRTDERIARLHARCSARIEAEIAALRAKAAAAEQAAAHPIDPAALRHACARLSTWLIGLDDDEPR
jgi:hypothetical protein